jgi:hypothetical protein
MKNLSWVQDDPIGVYDAIVAAKKHKRHRRALERLRQRIKDAYRRYGMWKPELHRLRALGQRLSARERKALLHCYEGAHLDESSASPRDKLYAKIRALADVCPYCTITPVRTLDHYLPKDPYPEFAILTMNLVPSCSGCNSSRDFRDSTGERALIHPYFDTIADEKLLFAKVRVVNGKPEVEFDVKVSGCKNATFAGLYERHVTLLKLRKRYRRWALSDYGLYSILSPDNVWISGMTRDEVRQKLQEQANKEERRLGANHFRVVLMRAVAASDEYLDHCLGGAP